MVAPEILDELDAEDLRAVRSRRDLRLVNWFMRGESWILDELHQIEGLQRVVELGAGDGSLATAILNQLPHVDVTCVDLIDRPSDLDPRVTWWQGDVLHYESYGQNTVVVANLFLHHLETAELKQLADKICEVRMVLAAEPYRSLISMLMSRCLYPFVNDVTRHDMPVSIRAGFRRGELDHSFGDRWKWSEHRGLFGGIRIMGTK
ncbi:MAG: class I SAM-dependent methyltransferase [Akkermansiaceae bacterium]